MLQHSLHPRSSSTRPEPKSTREWKDSNSFTSGSVGILVLGLAVKSLCCANPDTRQTEHETQDLEPTSSNNQSQDSCHEIDLCEVRFDVLLQCFLLAAIYYMIRPGMIGVHQQALQLLQDRYLEVPSRGNR